MPRRGSPTGPVGWRSPTRYAVAGLLSLGLVIGMSPSVAAQEAGPDGAQLQKLAGQLRAELQRETAGGDPMEVLVVLDSSPDLSRAGSRSGGAVSALRDHARQAQRPVLERIAGGGGTVENTFWLKNMVLARVSPDTLVALTALDEVDRIIPNIALSVPDQPQLDEPDQGTQAATYTWGLEKIGVDQIHSELGLRGQGTRVAVLDTGVDIAHPDLAGSMVSTDPDDPRFPGGWMEIGRAHV